MLINVRSDTPNPAIDIIMSILVSELLNASDKYLQADNQLPFHFNIRFSSRALAQVFQEITTFEVFIRVDNGLELCRSPRAIIFDLFNLLLVDVIEDPMITRISHRNNMQGI